MSQKELRFSLVEQEILKSLNSLAGALSEGESIDGFVNYFKKRRAFTPKQLLMLFRKFRAHKIQYKPSNFKIVIKRHREQEQILLMTDPDIVLIWGALSRTQKDWSKNKRGWKGKRSVCSRSASKS